MGYITNNYVEKGAEAPGLFGYKAFSCPAEVTLLGEHLRSNRRLRLFYLLLRPGIPNPTVFTLPCCPLCYSLSCRNCVIPSINTLIKMLMVEMPGTAPGSKTHFSLYLSSRTLQQYSYLLNLRFSKLNSAILESSGFR